MTLAPEQIIAIPLIILILWNISRKRREVGSWLKDETPDTGRFKTRREPTPHRPWWH